MPGVTQREVGAVEETKMILQENWKPAKRAKYNEKLMRHLGRQRGGRASYPEGIRRKELNYRAEI